MQVRIFWRSNITGFTGNGTAYMTVEAAKSVVEKANKDFHGVTHWYQ